MKAEQNVVKTVNKKDKTVDLCRLTSLTFMQPTKSYVVVVCWRDLTIYFKSSALVQGSLVMCCFNVKLTQNNNIYHSD